MQAVDVDVAQRAAFVFLREHGDVGAGEVFVVAAEMLVVVGVHEAHGADLREDFAELVEIGQVDVGDGLEDEEAALARQGEELGGLLHRGGEGFLQEDVLAGQERLLRGVEMERVGQGHVDEVDVGPGEHLRVVGVDVRDAEAGSLLPVARAYGYNFVACHGLHRIYHLGDDHS